MLHNLLSSSPAYLIDVVEPFAIWGTVGIVALLLVACLLIGIFKKEQAGSIIKKVLFGFLIYSLVLGIFLLILEITKKYDLAYLEDKYVNKDIITHVFIPILITALLCLISAITLFILAKKQSKTQKIVAIVCGAIIMISIIVSLITIYLYYSKNIVGDGYYTGEHGKLNSVILWVASALFVGLIIALTFVIGRKNKAPFDTRCIAFAGVTIAISFALSYIKFEGLWIQGGSITLASFLPICLFANTYGMKKGLLVGFIYGLLQAIQDPYIVHPAQFLLDYPIAFATICLAGLPTDLELFNTKPRLSFAVGVATTGLFRYIAHTISGVFAFGAYAADEGANFLIYSAGYNSYVLVDITIVIIVGVILFSSKGFNKEVQKLKAK